MIELESRLVDRLQEEFGDHLRVVATYEDEKYVLHFMREDIRKEYSEEEVEAVFNQISIEGMGYQHFEQKFRTGDLECAVYGFELASIFHFPTDAFNGLVVAIDRDVQFNPDSIIRVCRGGIAAS